MQAVFPNKAFKITELILKLITWNRFFFAKTCTLKHTLFVLTYENQYSHHEDGGNTMPSVRTVIILEGARDQKAMFRRKFAVQVGSMELGIFYPQEHVKYK